jgi:hypothetical protein
MNEGHEKQEIVVALILARVETLAAVEGASIFVLRRCLFQCPPGGNVRTGR